MEKIIFRDVDLMAFDTPWALVFILIFIVLMTAINSKRKTFYLSSKSKKVDDAISININRKKVRIKNMFTSIGILLLIVVTSGPQIGTRVKPVERKGVDIVIAFDTSSSMDAEDVTPSRIKKAKFEMNNLIKSLKGDRIAIIVFAGTSHMYLPLTTDYEAAMLFLNEIDTDMIPTKGTVLSSAISKGLDIFTEEFDKFKVMVLVSDGEDHDDKAIELAKQSSKTGLIINTVGVGSKSGSLIPIRDGKKSSTQYMRDNEGRLITSTLNESNLREIAKFGGGSYFWFSNSADSYLDILAYIEELEKKLNEEIEKNAEVYELASDVSDDFAEFYDGLESFVSTISMFYYAILLLSIGIFVISICQFLDKPWGTKALLSSTGLVLVLLLITGVYETSSFSQLSEDYEDLTGDEMEEITFFEVNGTIGAYCAGLCFALYGLLAYIGRPKSPPVQLVMN